MTGTDRTEVREEVARGLSHALRREPIIVGLLVVMLVLLAADLYFAHQRFKERSTFWGPIITDCFDVQQQTERAQLREESLEVIEEASEK